MSIGGKLKVLRIEKGITQKVIADYLGVKVNSYSQYENDQRKPSIDVLSKVAEFYGILGTSFFTDDKNYDLGFEFLKLLLDDYYSLIWVANDRMVRIKDLLDIPKDSSDFDIVEFDFRVQELLKIHERLEHTSSLIEKESNIKEIEDFVDNYLSGLSSNISENED
ncbi:MAG: helix-turn-helix transcriptional regulator [Erysipelothrix sp.]|nr:helix-turn-helix transcriptional regulator [Erysipelothrix sp.]